MKKLLSTSLAAAALAAGALAFGASDRAGGTHFAVGVVQQADRAARVVTLAHEPVASVNWPAMTMQFAVADAALFDRLSAGRQVAFEFVERGGDYRIVNAIPLAQASRASSTQHGAHEGMQGGMMGHDMAGMRAMCEGMMGQMHGGKH